MPSTLVRLVLVAGALLAFPPQGSSPARIVAIGDVHGGAGAFSSILQRAGLIDAQQKWIGGNAILVQTGDVTDRGTDVRAALDLLMALEPMAAKAGGRVHALAGNHEFMNMLGETRDVTPEIFQTFADAESESRRDRAFTAAQKLGRGLHLDREAWMKTHPIGFVEYREAFKPNGRYGKWLRAKNVVVEVNGNVFMHGGISPDKAPDSIEDVNKRARQDLAAFDEGVRWLEQLRLVTPVATLGEIVAAADTQLRPIVPRLKAGEPTEEDQQTARALGPIIQIDSSSLLSPNGPVWFRGYATWSDSEGGPLMAGLLRKYRVKRFVTAHTPLAPAYRIVRRFGGDLFLIDTGLLDGKYYPGGRASALEISGDAITAIYEDGRSPFWNR